MPFELVMPKVDIDMTEGVLSRWLKAEGQVVQKGEELFEVETAKTTIVIESPASGVLAKQLYKGGETLAVGTVIGFIATAGETFSSQPTQTAPQRSGQVFASPAARRVAKELGVDLSRLQGTGPGGRITEQDVRAASTSATPTARRIMLSGHRQAIAQRVTRSARDIPQFHVKIAVDMSRANQVRAQVSPAPSYTALLVFALGRALAEFPLLNATLEGQEIVIPPDVNLGILVALEENLLAPVLHRANRKSLSDIARETEELTRRARDGRLSPHDLSDATFTLSNLGMFGVEDFTALVLPPQCAILAAGAIVERAVPQGRSLVFRPEMRLTLSADHRIADGAYAARFLSRLREVLEHLDMV